MTQYLIGIDNGNTVTKVSLIDTHGHECATASRSAETIMPQPGWAERDMTTLWHNTAQAIREVIDSAGINANQVLGVGCTGHGNGLYVLDSTLNPLRHAIQSIDTRAAALIQEWTQKGLRERMTSFTAQAFYPAQTVALLAWLKRYERESYDRVGAVLLCKDYINYCLTGEITTDYTDMSAANLIDSFNKCYSTELLELFDIPEIEAALPQLVQSVEIVGQVTQSAAKMTGLAVGTPVISGMIDIDASAIGVGVTTPGVGCILIGTWSINQVVVAQPPIASNLFLVSPFADPHFWLVLEGSATSAANLEWFVQQFCAEEREQACRRDISVYDVCNELVANIPPKDASIIFHPFLYGSNIQDNIHASFYGIEGWHSRAHLLRAVYEGVLFGHMYHVENLNRAGVTFGKVRLGGGGARSEVWCQMLADLIDLPVEVPMSFETGTRGVALTAGIGTGVYSSFEQAVAVGVAVGKTYLPNKVNTSIYQTRYQEYKRLTERQ
jgi:L-xylulokinase